MSISLYLPCFCYFLLNQLKKKHGNNTKKSTEKFKITGNLDAISKKLKAKYPQLTDADLKFEAGKENEMISRLEKRLNKNHEEVIEILNKIQLEKV